MPESRKKVVVEERPDWARISVLAVCIIVAFGVAAYYFYSQTEMAAEIFMAVQRSQTAPTALEFLVLNQLSPMMGVFQHGSVNSTAYFDLNLQNLTNQNATNGTLTGYTCSGTQCNFTIVIDNDNSSALSYFLNLSDYTIQSVFYNASDGSLRNVSELSQVGQGNWSYNSSILNFSLAGGDGWDYGVRDTAVGGSRWLNSTGGLVGRVNVSNDFITVEMTENGTRVYNSSGKVIFNASFNDSVRVDNRDLTSLYGGGTRNKTAYFFDWAQQRWVEWGAELAEFEEDFDTDTWTKVGTRFSVDTGADDEADWDGRRNGGTNNGMYTDLGPVSEAKWLLRGKLVIVNFTQDAGATNGIVFGIQNSTETDTDVRRDGVYFGLQLGNSGYSNEFHAFDTENELLAHDGVGAGKSNFSSTTPAAGTYFIEVARNSPDVMTVGIYNDSSYSVLLESRTHPTTSGVGGLRYLVMGLAYDGGTTTASFDGHWDDVRFWNGISSTPSNAPDWADPRNKQAFKWRYGFSGDANVSRPGLNITFLMTAHDPFFRTFVDADPAKVVATGGTVTYFGGRTIHTFTSNGTFSVSSGGPVEYLVVAGGGGGGGATTSRTAGGGGAGGYRNGTGYTVSAANYSIVVGTGGAGGSVGGQGSNGTVSIFDTVTSAGGGAGGYAEGGGPPAYGGSVGGSGGGTGGGLTCSMAGGLGNVPSTSPPQGNNGGACSGTGGGGGGGAGGAGGTGSAGVGISSSISGSPVTRAAGGAVGGSAAGSANTGDGGGGATGVAGGGAGGSGVVVISYAGNVTHNVTFPFSLPENRTSVTTADSGLVGYWNLNDGGGSNATDSSGNLLTGRIRGPLQWISNSSCKFGNCISFTRGTDRDLGLGNPSTLQLTGDMTISAWVMVRDFADNNFIVSKKISGDSNMGYQISLSATGPELCFGDGASADCATGGATISAGTWYHVVGAISGTAITTYVDGTVAGTGTFGGTRQNPSTDAYMGVLYSAGNAMNGILDDVKIYNRALSTQEIRQLYLTGINQQKPGIYFTKNNATDNEEVLFAATNWKNVNHSASGNTSGFNITSNHTDWFRFNYAFNSTQNNNFMFALGTMGRMNTTVFNPTNNASAFSFETMESVANSTLTWYDLRRPAELEEDFSRCGTNECDGLWDSDNTAVFSVNTATDKIDFSNDASSVAMKYDLGTVSDMSWILRLNFTIGSLGGTNLRILHMYLSNTGGASSTNMDGIQTYFYDADNNVYASTMNGVRPDQVTDQVPLSINPTAGVSYYVEMSRINETAAKVTIYSNPGYTTVLGTRTWQINASINDLKYLTLSTYSGALGTFTATVDDVQFWDGVSSVNSSLSYPISGGSQHYMKPSFNYDGGAAGIWRLDEGSGLNATDSSGNGNTGALTNGPIWISNTSCKIGGCVSFDGSNDYIRTPNAVNLGSRFSVEFWMKPRQLYNFGDPVSAGINDLYLSFVTYATGQMEYIIGNGVSWGTSVLPGVGTFANDKWFHVVGTYDGAYTRLYVDGVFRGAASNPGYTMNQVINIGSRPAVSYYFNGLVDDVRIYRNVLTDVDVRNHYQREATKYYDDFGTAAYGRTYRYLGVEDSNTTLQPVTPRGAVAHLRFNDNSTTNSTDSSGYNNVPTSSNGPTWVRNSTCMPGFGGCMMFDGVDSIMTGYAPQLTAGKSVTIAAWVRSNGLQAAPAKYFLNVPYGAGGLGIGMGHVPAGQTWVAMTTGTGPYTSYDTYTTFNYGDDRWHFYAASYDGSYLRQYADGILINQSAASGNIAFQSDRQYSVGNLDPTYASTFAYRGAIDEAMVIDRALSVQEIQDLYLGGVQSHSGDLVGWWRFNENTTHTNYTLDSSGGGNAGDVRNRPSWMQNSSCRHSGCLLLNGQNQSLSVSNASSTDRSMSSLMLDRDMTISAWVRFPATLTNYTEDVTQSMVDKGNYKLYFDWQDGRLKFEVDNATATSWTTSYDGSAAHAISLAEYGGKIYFGLAGGAGDGDILAFDGSSWSTSYAGGEELIGALAVYNGKLYAGQGDSAAGDGDILVFDGSSWSTSYAGSSIRIGALAVYNGRLYAGIRGSAGEGDIVVFDGVSWTTSYNGAQDSIASLAVYNGRLYAGQGSAAGAGDVLVFDGSTWSTSYDGAQEYIFGLGVYNGRLYAGQGSGAGDGDILAFDGSSWSTAYDGSQASVRAFTTYNGRLYAGEATTGKIIVFDGSSWSTAYDPPGSTDIFSLGTYNGRLYAGQGGSAGDSDVFVFGNNVLLNQSATISSGNRSSWPGGAWHHLAATYDGSTMKIYLNGTLDATRSASFPVETGRSPLLIGSDFGSGFFNGSIDDVKVWRRALTADEVANEYRQNQDQHSLYGNVHRVVSADGLPSVTVNISDHDNIYQRDHDQRVITFMGTNLDVPDTTPPTISVQSPVNSTYSDSQLWANATINEAGNVWLRLDGGSNTSMSNTSGNWNAQLSVGNGPHGVVFYANDSSGNEAAPVSVFFTVSPLVISMDINRTFSSSFPWWADNITISGWATYNGGLPFNSTNGTIVINQTMPNGARDRIACQTTGHATTGFYSCWYIANYEVGETALTVHAVRTSGVVAGSLAGTIRVKPNYGQEPAGSTPRYVLEIPSLIQEPSGRIRIVLDRVTVSAGAPN